MSHVSTPDYENDYESDYEDYGYDYDANTRSDAALNLTEALWAGSLSWNGKPS